jgi:hypothetical protein
VDQLIEDLEGADPRQAEIVRLRFFGGLTVDEVAESAGHERAKRRGRVDHYPGDSPEQGRERLSGRCGSRDTTGSNKYSCER